MLLKFHKTSTLGNKSSFGNCFQYINLRFGKNLLFSQSCSVYIFKTRLGACNLKVRIRGEQ